MKRILFALLVLPALAAGCGSSYGGGSKSSTYSTTSKSSTTAAAPKMNKHGVTSVSGMSSVNVTMHDYYFSPTVIKGTAGQKLTVHLSNMGTITHNFSVSTEGISQDVPVNGKATVQVTLPKSGATVFFCRFHHALGMVGELVAPRTGMTTGSPGGSTPTTPTTTSGGYGY